MWATENMFKKFTEQELDAMIIRHMILFDALRQPILYSTGTNTS